MPLKHITKKQFLRKFHYKTGLTKTRRVTRTLVNDKPDRAQKTLE